MTRIYVEYDWALKVLRMVFRIEFKDFGDCRYGDYCYLCVLGDYVFVLYDQWYMYGVLLRV